MQYSSKEAERLVERAARMRVNKNTHRISVGEKHCVRRGYRWECDIKKHLKEVRRETEHCVHLVQNKEPRKQGNKFRVP